MSEEWERYGIAGFADPVEVGRGGFGVVYRARQASLDRTVAVKVIGQAQRRSRVENELRALGALSGHPHIVTVYSHGESANGYFYIVMDHLPGGSLLDAGGATPEEAARAGVKLAGALETAHRRGILHRDVKPANVLLNAFGEPQLADFGIARLVSAQSSSTGQVTGTLAHTPAELLEGDEATVRSDVFSLGSTLYSVLTGHPPFMQGETTSVATLLYRIVQGAYPDLRPRGVPAALADVIDRMLSRDPLARPPSAEAAGQALQQAQASLGWAVTPLLVGAADGSAVVQPVVGSPWAEQPDPSLTVGGAAPPAWPTNPDLPGGVPDVPSGASADGSSAPPAVPDAKGRRRLLAIAAAVLTVILVGSGISLALAGRSDDPSAEPGPDTGSPAAGSTAPPSSEPEPTVTELVPKPEVELDLGDVVAAPYVTFSVDHPDLTDLTLAVGVLDADGRRLCEIPLAMPDGGATDQRATVSASVETCADFLPPAVDQPWFLRVIDGPGEGTGAVTAFELVLAEAGSVTAEALPAAIPDNDLQGLVLLVPVEQDNPVPTEEAAGPAPDSAPAPPAATAPSHNPRVRSPQRRSRPLPNRRHPNRRHPNRPLPNRRLPNRRLPNLSRRTHLPRRRPTDPNRSLPPDRAAAGTRRAVGRQPGPPDDSRFGSAALRSAGGQQRSAQSDLPHLGGHGRCRPTPRGHRGPSR